MTQPSKLEQLVEQWAVDVWRKAVDATDTFIRFKTKPDQAAARVIETAFAEREAAKDAEIARLNETVRRVQASARTLDACQKQISDTYVTNSAINREAVATLDSERAANAILTEENTDLREQVAELVKEKATGHFERTPGYEYRPLYTRPFVDHEMTTNHVDDHEKANMSDKSNHPEPAPGLPHLAAYIEQIGRPETLDDAIAERDAWIESAAQFSRNEDYYRGLLDEIAVNFGQDAHTADDGSVSQDPLRAKVPELVAARIQSDAVELARVEREVVALAREAADLAFQSIQRMRAAHVACLDLTNQAEALLRNLGKLEPKP